MRRQSGPECTSLQEVRFSRSCRGENFFSRIYGGEPFCHCHNAGKPGGVGGGGGGEGATIHFITSISQPPNGMGLLTVLAYQ